MVCLLRQAVNFCKLSLKNLTHHISFNDQVLCDIHMTLSWICFCCVVQCDPWPNCIAIPQWFYWLIGYYSFCLITISYRTLLGNNKKNMLHTPCRKKIPSKVSSKNIRRRFMVGCKKSLVASTSATEQQPISAGFDVQTFNQDLTQRGNFSHTTSEYLSHSFYHDQFITQRDVTTNDICVVCYYECNKKKCNTSSPLIDNQFLLYSARPSRAHSVW